MDKIGETIVDGKTVAISENGTWVAIEIRDYGIFRVNVETLQTRRVYAPGFDYGYGRAPRVEMAISNDGTALGIMGWRMGIELIAINDTCGDVFNQYMQPRYQGAVTPCRTIPPAQNYYITNFQQAINPRFSSDSQLFSFDVQSSTVSSLHVTLFSNTPTGEDISIKNRRYIAVGDSFTSGEGETNSSFYINPSANHCHVSTRSYPYLLANTWNTEAINTACSGATMEAARGKHKETGQTDQLAALESYALQFATVGIGGNDAGLMGKLKDCLGVNTCKWAESAQERKSTALEIKNLYPRLKDFYHEITARTYGSVLVVGYPLIISQQPECVSGIGLLLNQTERIFMNESIRYLNQVIKAAATDSGLAYTDTQGAFSGDELCASLTSSVMNDVRLGKDIAPINILPFLKVIGSESFHPKPAGHTRIADMVLHNYPQPEHIPHCAQCTAQTTAPSQSAYWSASGPELTPRKASIFLDKSLIVQGDMVKVSLPALSFKPASNVTLELHSDVKSLGVFQAAEDGSLSVTLASKDFEPGIHSVHALGVTFSDTNIDVYDFLDVDTKTVLEPTHGTKPTIPSDAGTGDSTITGGSAGVVRNGVVMNSHRQDGLMIHTAGTQPYSPGESPSQVLGTTNVKNPATSNPSLESDGRKSVLGQNRNVPFRPLGFIVIGSLVVIIISCIYVFSRRKQP